MFSLFNKYVIASINPDADFGLEDFDIIISSSRDEAKSVYNKQHDCMYGAIHTTCLAAKINDKIEIYDNACPKRWIEKLKE